MQRIEPGPGQQSVWDFPRPPAVEPSPRRVRVEWRGHLLADSHNASRVLETSHPPAWYIPRADCDLERLEAVGGRSFCEFKGSASYFDAVDGDARVQRVAWTYEAPTPRFASITGHLCFYASRVDACYVDEERVQPQEGDFYGGWITSDVVGPFKGAPGTWGW